MSTPNMSMTSITGRSRVDLEALLRPQYDKAVRGSTKMGFKEFMEVTKCRSELFALRLFNAVDVDDSGDISFEEFVDMMHILQTRDSKRRIDFIFQLFDVDGDGCIQYEELKDILRASVEESDASLPDDEIEDLSEKLKAVFEGFRASMDSYDPGEDGITIEVFEQVLEAYPDVLEGLSLEGVAMGREKREVHKSGTPLAIKLAMSKIADNSRLVLTYSLLTFGLVVLFFWRFLLYTSNCNGADMDMVDPVSGLTRQEVMDNANAFRMRVNTQDGTNLRNLTEHDLQYMAFSWEMSQMDPVKCQDARRRKLLSWALPVAKGSGQVMKGVFTLILLPVSRNLMTTLRKTFLRRFFDFDEAIEFHRNLGRLGLFFSWVHTLCHVVDVIRWADTGRFERWSWAFPDDDMSDPEEVTALRDEDGKVKLLDGNDPEEYNQLVKYDGIPLYLFRDQSSQPTAGELLSSWFGVTGIILIVIYTVAALFALDYPKKLKIFDETRADKHGAGPIRNMVLAIGRFLRNFNLFWYSHHLFAIFYIALLVHPLPTVPSPSRIWGWSDSWCWVGIPVLIYLAERILRFWRTKSYTRVVAADLFPGNVTGLQVMKPKSMTYQAGMYAFICIPELSNFEWHPFTFTSSPGDNYLSFHIRVAGDWTKALHDMVRKHHEAKGTGGLANGMIANTRRNITRLVVKGVAGPSKVVQEKFPFQVHVDGPFGAPAQDHKDYKVMILVGAGIGVTPFASVLNDILEMMKKKKESKTGGHLLFKVYFYWTIRLRTEAVWFKHLLEEIANEDEQGYLDINIHVTSIRKANDVRVALLRFAQQQVAEQDGVDVINKIKTRAITKFGRPNWDEAFLKAKREFPEEKNIGVFFCGPNGLAKVLHSHCVKHSDNRVSYDFMKESFG